MITAAALQMNTGLDPAENSDKVFSWLGDLIGKRMPLDLVVLPEMFTFRALGKRPVEEVVLPVDGEVARGLAAAARDLGANLVAGTFLARHRDGRVRNTSLVFDRNGKLLSQYSKTHLFDSPDEQESEYVRAGDSLCVIELDIGKVGVVVCYELRFPEIARSLGRAGAHILAVPNSWPSGADGQGRRDLKTILPATSILAQTAVVHANQIGECDRVEMAGLSGVFDVTGEVVTRMRLDEGWLVGSIDLDRVGIFRTRRPVYEQLRPELY